jgi:hypothetical protein
MEKKINTRVGMLRLRGFFEMAKAVRSDKPPVISQ